MRVAVIGAGPAGLTAAVRLSGPNCQVDVYEAAGAVGGLARSIRLWGQTVDLGPHRFFSHDRRVNELWLEMAGRDYAIVKRLTRILYKGKLFRYPLEAFEALTKLGFSEAARCLASYARGRIGPRASDSSGSFEDWVCRRFGRRLFEIFFKTYSEKLWGIPCQELDADFAAQRIKKFSLSEAIKGALNSHRSEHRTLADEFAYPLGGTGMIYERMADRVRANGGQVFLKTPVRRILTARNCVHGLELENGTINEYDHIISTMPLTLLVERLPGISHEVIQASRQLKFRNTILVFLEIEGSRLWDDQWIYVHSPELQTGRITNFRNWVPQMCNQRPNTIVAMEYWCDGVSDGDGDNIDEARKMNTASTAAQSSETAAVQSANSEAGLWSRPDADSIALARRELISTGLIKDNEQVLNGFVYRIPRCYPVYRRGYRDALRPIQECLGEIQGLQVIGRYGAFKYNNQDHSILMGILAAENILAGANHNLWNVNADYDTYQEGWRISEAGLTPLGTHAQ